MCNKLPSFLVTLTCLLVLPACVNLKPVPSQTKSYTLGPVEAQVPDAAITQKALIYVVCPQLPTYLDSAWITYLSADGELNKLADARWAEPLAEGIARAVSLYLSGAGVGSIEGYYPWPNAASKSTRLSLNFERIGALESGAVQVVVSWTLKQSDGTSKGGRYNSDNLHWEVGQPETLVAALNSALRELADEIGAGITAP